MSAGAMRQTKSSTAGAHGTGDDQAPGRVRGRCDGWLRFASQRPSSRIRRPHRHPRDRARRRDRTTRQVLTGPGNGYMKTLLTSMP